MKPPRLRGLPPGRLPRPADPDSIGVDAAGPLARDRSARGQPHDRRADVVRLVRLPDAVLWVGPVPEGERPAQPSHVDPVLVVAERIDVRPADRRAERDAPHPAVLAAAGVVEAARRAAHGPRTT